MHTNIKECIIMKNRIILWHEICLNAISPSVYADTDTISFTVYGHITVYLIAGLAGFSCSVCGILYTREYYIHYWCQRRQMLETQLSLDCSSAIVGGIDPKVIVVLHSFFLQNHCYCVWIFAKSSIDYWFERIARRATNRFLNDFNLYS